MAREVSKPDVWIYRNCVYQVLSPRLYRLIITVTLQGHPGSSGALRLSSLLTHENWVTPYNPPHSVCILTHIERRDPTKPLRWIRYLQHQFPSLACRWWRVACFCCVAGNRGPDEGCVAGPHHGKRRALQQVRNKRLRRRRRTYSSAVRRP